MKRQERGDEATKRRPARDTASGKFEAASPFTDPALFDQLVRVVRAVTDLEPMLSASVLVFKQLGDHKSAAMASMVGTYLASLKDSALRDLAADPESLREAKKKRMEAKRLGNIPLEEQQRVQGMADAWKLEAMTPLRLAQSHPQVLRSIMEVSMHVGLRLQLDQDQPLQLPADVVDLVVSQRNSKEADHG